MRINGAQRLAFIVCAVASIESEAHAQSPAAHHMAHGLLKGCEVTRLFSGDDAIFVGRPFFNGDPGALVIPMQVETAFRGVEAGGVILVRSHGGTYDAEQSYLVYGFRRPDSGVVDIQILQSANADSAKMAMRLYASSMPSESHVTLLGAVEVGKNPDEPPFKPVTGLRIRVSAEGFVKDLFTEKDGVFSLAGIPPGRLELTPFLPESLKIFQTGDLTYEASAGECVHRLLMVVSNRRERRP